MNISIVVPFYNEKKHISKVVEDVLGCKLPIVLVDDGSTDTSSSYLKKYKGGNVTLLTHRVNLGKGAAMKTGADYAFSKGADAVIFMDGDEQHSPKDLEKFRGVLEEKKYDAVFGTRNYNYGVPLIRFLGNKFTSILIAVLFGIYVSDVLCGFKALTKKAYKAVRWDSTGYGVETEMVARIAKMKMLFHEIPVETLYHDKVKGVTVLDAFGIMFEIIKWRFTL